MKFNLVDKFVHTLGDKLEVIALAEKLEQDYSPHNAGKVYRFLCEQYGLIKSLAAIENEKQRGFIANLYRSNIRNHIPNSFDNNLRCRCTSIIHARMQEVFEFKRYGPHYVIPADNPISGREFNFDI